ncbi:MAG: hypothetical protein D4R72_02825 [Nitrosopumilales archaeon]|nr:MAG: hypothetical protein D4R72_02825 [Nitrosopumilales archaeon]
MKMTYQQNAKAIKGSKEREMAIVKEIQLHPNIHQNALKRLVVPKHMAGKTFERTKKELVERRAIYLKKVGNQYHYTVALGDPDSSVKVNLDSFFGLLKDMTKELKEMEEKYPKFSKNKKVQLFLDVSKIYSEIRIQMFKILEISGKPRQLGEYDFL